MAAGNVIVINEDSSGKKGNIFDGVDDYVLHDAFAVARVAAGDTIGTFSAWVYVDTIVGNNTILSVGDNNVNEYLWFSINDGKLEVIVYQGAAVQSAIEQTTASIEAKTWTHVALVNGPDIKKLYVNGEVVPQTNSTVTDPDAWFDVITGADKFATGILVKNATQTQDFKGALGQVKYWSLDLSDDEVRNDYKGTSTDALRQAVIDATLQFNVTMEYDGTTDSGLGADNGTLTGHAYYGGIVSDHSYELAANTTGHAAEKINSILDGNVLRTTIVRGD